MMQEQRKISLRSVSTHSLCQKQFKETTADQPISFWAQGSIGIHRSHSKGVIVATTRDTAPYIKDIAKRYSAQIFTGSEDDVLSRYVSCIAKWDIKNVIRATGDNPLVSIEYLDKAIELHRRRNADLTTYPLLPYGTGVEVIRGKVLEGVAKLTNDPFEREHLTQYIYRHEPQYRIVRGIPDPEFQRRELCFTVDTDEDYRRIAKIYRDLYSGRPINLLDVINYIDGKAHQ